jgi:hypothetical protein
VTTGRRGTLPSIHEVTIDKVGRYLLANGWKKGRDQHGKEAVYNGPKDDSGDTIRIYMPTDNQSRMLSNRVEDALQILGAVEGRSKEELLYSLVLQGIDSQEKRITSAGLKRQIPLTLAMDVINHLRQMASYSAVHEDFPAPHFDHVSGASSTFLERCFFPHTFEGSFGMAMEVNIPSAAETALTNPEEPYPFERRVMKRIAVGLKSCEASLKSGDAGPLVESYKRGLNGNMCLSLSAFAKKLKTYDVISSFSWTEDWRDYSLQDTSEILISPEAAPLLHEAGRALKAMKQAIPYHCLATIKTMNEDVPAGRLNEAKFLDPARTIVLLDEYEPARLRSIHVSLDRDDHQEACHAYEGGFVVDITGLLERKGNSLVMTEYFEFKVTKMKKADVVEEIRKKIKAAQNPPLPSLSLFDSEQ